MPLHIWGSIMENNKEQQNESNEADNDDDQSTIPGMEWMTTLQKERSAYFDVPESDRSNIYFDPPLLPIRKKQDVDLTFDSPVKKVPRRHFSGESNIESPEAIKARLQERRMEIMRAAEETMKARVNAMADKKNEERKAAMQKQKELEMLQAKSEEAAAEVAKTRPPTTHTIRIRGRTRMGLRRDKNGRWEVKTPSEMNRSIRQTLANSGLGIAAQPPSTAAGALPINRPYSPLKFTANLDELGNLPPISEVGGFLSGYGKKKKPPLTK